LESQGNGTLAGLASKFAKTLPFRCHDNREGDDNGENHPDSRKFEPGDLVIGCQLLEFDRSAYEDLSANGNDRWENHDEKHGFPNRKSG
jgi:hypothetical protein